jgi:1-acyl-sn-glycerol-3-phosphate acyltransferase
MNMNVTNAPTTQRTPLPKSDESPAVRESPAIYGLTRLVLRPIAFLTSRFQVEGLDNIPASGPVILAMNHIHWMDIPLASLHVPRVTHYMAKIELFSAPLLGGFIRKLGAFPVRRGEGDREAIRMSERILAEGRILVIFPEGHRSGNGVLLKAHPGAGYIALRTGAPVIAVAVSGTQQIFKRFRPTVTIRYSKPFTVQLGDGKRTRDSTTAVTNQIMYQIAALLPPEARGPYGDVAAQPTAFPTLEASGDRPE